jgi:hypothetical protein
MRALYLLMAASLMSSTPSWAQGTRWDAVRNFSFRHNVSGAWSYSTNALPLMTTTSYCVDGVKGWSTFQPIPNALAIVKNYTGATVSCETIRAPVDHLWMDPEGGSVTVTWTAPVSGTFTIRGDFLGIDVSEASHPVSITGPAGALFNATIAAYNAPATFKVKTTLTAGQSIAFTVSTGSSYSYLSTGLDATVIQN